MASLLDPQVLGRVKGYEVRSLRLVESFMVGMHKSTLLGISTEFAQHRPYVSGDDTKHLDWKVFARTDRTFVKQYEAETSMQVLFLLDASRSMFFKGDGSALSKFEYAGTTVAALAYLLMQQHDAFGLVLFDREVKTFLPPRGSMSHFRTMTDLLEKATPGEETDLTNVLATVAPRLKRRSLVVLLSDFVADTAELGTSVGQVSFGHHDLTLFHVEDAAERDFLFAGQTIFTGPENEGRLLCEPRDLRLAYLAARRRHLDSVRESCLRFGYEVEEMPTDADMGEALSKFLAFRQLKRTRR
jgi:uncharacterized protein (DUF58 family)